MYFLYLTRPFVVVAALAAFALAACGGDGPVLRIAGIPDQDSSRLARRYEVLVDYLAKQLGVDVVYVPTTNYAATVTGFVNDDIQMAWFGGLTGVQARRQLPGSAAFAQRPRDEEFHSVFVVGADIEAEGLADLAGLTFTFGSENSTSGHLMPRHFMLGAGVDADVDLDGPPGYSGSHDRTWKLVESGTFQAGALSEAVWDAAVEEGRVDLSKVRAMVRTPAYYDYSWTLRGDADDRLGEGFSERVRDAILAIDDPAILELFQTEEFIPTRNENYDAILDIAEALGIVE